MVIDLNYCAQQPPRKTELFHKLNPGKSESNFQWLGIVSVIRPTRIVRILALRLPVAVLAEGIAFDRWMGCFCVD